MKNRYRSLAFFLVLALILASFPAAMAASYTGTINTDKVFFRLKANTTCDYHLLFKKGAQVTVTGTSGDFYAVTYQSKKGYVMKKFVTVSSSAQSALNGSGNSSANTAKSTPYAAIASAKTIAAIGSMPSATRKGSTGANVAKLQQALKLKGYYSSAVDGIYGNGTAASVERYQRAIGVSQTGTADTTTLKVLFGKMTAAEAKKTQKAAATTTAATDPKMNGITKISQITVPSTVSKGNSGKNVLALQQALKIKGYYKAPINSRYDDATVEAVKAFQKARGLYVDGIAGNNTIKALFGQNAANYHTSTERLDWFHGGNGKIPRGVTFQVKDVYTGKVFKARRLFGTNHCDTEPATKADTAIFRTIYRYNSWARRPVLVRVNGHVYAGSMNGYAHGTSSIDNGFNGHFCIHFYNSRTHGTNRVDAAHQSCVAKAMNASW